MSKRRKAADMTKAEAARRALDVAGQLMGTNPARVEQAESRHERMREDLEYMLGVLPDEQKREMLVRAAYKGSEAVEQVLAAGVDPGATASFELRYNSAELDLEDIILNKDTALTAFAYTGHIRALKLLLASGADIEKANGRRKIPLVAAAYGGDVACIGRLLEEGAAVDMKDNAYCTALDWAASDQLGVGSEEAEALLKAHGASLR